MLRKNGTLKTLGLLALSLSACADDAPRATPEPAPIAWTQVAFGAAHIGEIALAPDGGIVAIGQYQGHLDMGGRSLTSIYEFEDEEIPITRHFLAKLDKDGDVAWLRDIGEAEQWLVKRCGASECGMVAVDPAGGMISTFYGGVFTTFDRDGEPQSATALAEAPDDLLYCEGKLITVSGSTIAFISDLEAGTQQTILHVDGAKSMRVACEGDDLLLGAIGADDAKLLGARIGMDGEVKRQKTDTIGSTDALHGVVHDGSGSLRVITSHGVDSRVSAFDRTSKRSSTTSTSTFAPWPAVMGSGTQPPAARRSTCAPQTATTSLTTMRSTPTRS